MHTEICRSLNENTSGEVATTDVHGSRFEAKKKKKEIPRLKKKNQHCYDNNDDDDDEYYSAGEE